ncbi:type II toxin-antitoxin system RelE/ParE family toxin [Methylobacterium sp. Leaf93]|uniref:type II toxin-antitoxin system RelE family toxin n=1 Tax=Methylobacterium sp. Leaf93 TaxID=1736249 RepID=UPI0007015182|nr:type II toxin-antitoxin system RelE/ParE family toxin [Methylobacterium sp. Leaf93]KQP02647.1 cytotoxic translational repressor of toxin-antitoxin stability system [Methylobacterium sp. Leaf93]
MRQITYTKEATKTLGRMPTNVSTLIRAKVKQYAEDPESLANNVKTLQGYENRLRLRVGDWRVLFNETGEVVAVLKVAPRGEAYD